MPKVSEDLKQQIRQSLYQRYQEQFGANYMAMLHKNLIPSPIEELAQTYTVSKSCVSKIRSEILNLGLMLRPLANPTP
jgi:hypothetical protein